MNRFGRSRPQTPESPPKLLLRKYVSANGTLSGLAVLAVEVTSYARFQLSIRILIEGTDPVEPMRRGTSSGLPIKLKMGPAVDLFS